MDGSSKTGGKRKETRTAQQDESISGGIEQVAGGGGALLSTSEISLPSMIAFAVAGEEGVKSEQFILGSDLQTTYDFDFDD